MGEQAFTASGRVVRSWKSPAFFVLRRPDVTSSPVLRQRGLTVCSSPNLCPATQVFPHSLCHRAPTIARQFADQALTTLKAECSFESIPVDGGRRAAELIAETM